MHYGLPVLALTGAVLTLVGTSAMRRGRRTGKLCTSWVTGEVLSTVGFVALGVSLYLACQNAATS